MIAFHNPLVGNNEGRYEMTEAIVEIEYLMASILDGMDSNPGLVPDSWDEAGVSLFGERGECLADSVRVARR